MKVPQINKPPVPGSEKKVEKDKIEYTTVAAHYSGEDRLYTFLVTREFSKTLKPKDIAVVKAANGLGVVRVMEIHSTSQATGSFKYRWAFQRIDMDEIKRLEAAEEAGLTTDFLDDDVDDIPW